jgi:hypothetical protein
LEEVLQCYANFAFDAANGLLKSAGKDRIGFFDPDGKLQFLVGVAKSCQCFICLPLAKFRNDS